MPIPTKTPWRDVFRALSFASALALTTVAANAQPHPNGYAGVSSSGRVFLFDSVGGVRSLNVGGNIWHYSAVMDARNNELLVLSNMVGIYRVDPVTGTALGTLSLVRGTELVVDGNGDLFVPQRPALLKIDQAGMATTVATLFGGINGMKVDPRTGDLLVQIDWAGFPLLNVTRDGQSITTVGTGFDSRYGMDYHIPTGAIFGGACCGDFTPSRNLYSLPAGASVATIFMSSPNPPIGVYSLKCDRASSATQRLVLGSLGRGQAGIFHLDLASNLVSTFSRLSASGPAPGPSLYGTEILYRRNVHTVRTNRGTWDVGVKIPEDAGRTYQIAVSATGIKPAVQLAGGRSAYIAVDALTIQGLSSGFGPLLTGLRGVLDSNGRASGRLDLSSLGSAVNGVRLFFLAVTLDASAPGGIKTITDPTVLVVEGV